MRILIFAAGILVGVAVMALRPTYTVKDCIAEGYTIEVCTLASK